MSSSKQRASAREGVALSGAEKEVYIRSVFDEIAAPYDRMNRVISLGRDQSCRRRLVGLSRLAPGASVLDLGTGTGDLALELAKAVAPGGSVLGLDLSDEMLKVARTKAPPSDVAIRFEVGNAESTGLPDQSMDVVAMGWCLRNVGSRPRVYAEVLRVLKPKGRFVSIDMSRPIGVFNRTGFWCYRHLLLPILVRVAGGRGDAWRYLAQSTDAFPTRLELEAEWRASGFSDVRSESLLSGALALHLGVRR